MRSWVADLQNVQIPYIVIFMLKATSHEVFLWLTFWKKKSFVRKHQLFSRQFKIQLFTWKSIQKSMHLGAIMSLVVYSSKLKIIQHWNMMLIRISMSVLNKWGKRNREHTFDTKTRMCLPCITFFVFEEIKSD